jgi:ubiquinone/menaquinone biosynthesis C-methylase UbiE
MVRLLPPEALIPTGPVDHADWNYRRLLGWIQRRRFQLVCQLLPPGRVDRLLEIGYGSGVFLPELARRCGELHGIDIHPHAAAVSQRLQEHGVTAQLVQGSAEAMPYAAHYFDCLVAVSSLEFIPEIAAAAQQMQRVLRPDGCLVLVTPGDSPLADLGLRILTGKVAREDYEDRRQRLMSALTSRFAVDARCAFPRMHVHLLRLYTALRMKPRG